MRRFVLLLVLCLGAFLPQTASAQVAPPTLSGEFLSSLLDVEVQGTCNPQGNSTFTFEVSGVAAGPYPGTFTERGSFTIGPQTIEFFPNQFGGRITHFHAEFEIVSPVGTVTGTKTLAVGGTRGVCGGTSGTTAGQIEVFERADNPFGVTYEATITTPDGSTYTDRGRSQIGFNYCGGAFCNQFPQPLAQMREFFRSDLLTPEPVDEEPEPPAVVVLTPPTAINTVGTTHRVTATATTSTAAPAGGVTVYFTVIGAVTTTGECTTNAQGQCEFTYTGPNFPGADLITGCADANDDGGVDVGEPCGEATKIWVLPVLVGTPGQVTGGGWITSTGGRVSFGFNAKSDGVRINGNCNVIDHATKTQIKCLTVDTLVVAGTHATFIGQARVNGAVTNYRIDVDDLGEPGILDTFKIQTDSGYTAAGKLEGGNIQIHK